MSAMRGRKKQLLQYAAIFFLVIFLVSGALLVLSLWENRQSEFPEGDAIGLVSTIEYEGKKYVLKEDVQTLLVLGLDKFEDAVTNDSYNNDQQADFVMLFVIDNRNETCAAIHINRDTMTDINILGVAGENVGTVNKQLALAHTYGNGREVSCGNVADAVSNLLYNVKVDHFVSVTMDSVPVYNDLVGGVEVTVLDDFTGVDDSLVKGEKVTLMGEQALRYIRSRKGLDDSTNATRMIRQRQYLEALYHKSAEMAKADEEFIMQASLKMSDYMVSDCSGNQLQDLFEKISGYEFLDIRSIEGTSVVGEKFMEFYPDVNSMKKIVVELFYQEEK